MGGFDLSGIAIRVDGPSPELRERLAREWAVFAAPEVHGPFLRVAVEYQDRKFDRGVPFAPKAMRSTVAPGSARYEMAEGHAVVQGNGRARLSLAAGLAEREFYTFVNLLRAVLAWSLPGRGGTLLHAAAVVLDGRAFVLSGPEGAGKSTFAARAEQGGAEVLSDDLVLLDGIAPHIEALGAPFRSTHETPSRRGRWPLAALLLPRKSGTAGLTAATRMAARATVAANLPFVADALEQDERVAALVERLASEVPCLELAFSPDPAFVELLRAWAP